MSNRNKFILIFTALFLIVMVLLFIGKKKNIENEHRDWNTIKESGRLRVVVEKSSLGFQVIGGEAEGFNYELVKAFADSNGLELEINPINDLDSAINGLWTHEYDLIASNLPNTTELNNQLSLTVSILNSRLMLIQFLSENNTSESDLLTSYSQLKDIEITIPFHSPYKMRLANLSEEISDSLRIRELIGVTLQDLVIGVSEGKIPFTICDELQARKLNRKYPNFDFSFPLGFNQQYAWAVNKKSVGLLDKLNEFLSDFLTMNDYWEIYRKYY